MATAFALVALAFAASPAEEPNYLERLRQLGLPCLEGGPPACHSRGARERAVLLRATIADMGSFYKERLGIQGDAALAVLDPTDWAKVNANPYGLPNVGGSPPVVFMPSTSGGFAFQLMMARKDAIPPEQLRTFLEREHLSYESVSDQFVDLIGLHELGHALTVWSGIDPGTHFLSEFLASYFAYAYISERQPGLRNVFDLIGRPSKVRPKNTSLDDFERLYSDVDDYGWYQGMFEVRVREVYRDAGAAFLEKVRKEFPAPAPASATAHRRVLERLEKLAPGFLGWARGFELDVPATIRDPDGSR